MQVHKLHIFSMGSLRKKCTITFLSEYRFDQTSFERYKQSERLLLKTANGENYSEDLELYLTLFSHSCLQHRHEHKIVTQLEMPKDEYKER